MAADIGEQLSASNSSNISEGRWKEVFLWIYSRIWKIAFGALSLLIVFWIDPFGTKHTGIETDAANSWNSAIKKLGIQPLYPPQENFRVGDIWIVASAAPTGGGRKTKPLEVKTLQDHAFRVGHIDLSEEIKINSNMPSFSSTVVAADGTMKAELIPATDTSTPSINLTMISYPGLHIATKTEIKTSFLEGLFNSSRHDDQIEDVSIPIAETYGTPSLEAIEALEKWCSAQDTAKFCVDDNARHIFASAVSPAILSKENGKYTTQLKVVLVNRVYMTRQLNVTRTWNVTTDIAQGAVPKGSTKQPDEQHGTQAEIDIASTSASYSDGLETRIETKEKFPRPLVFGFKSISFILPPKPKPK